jgi:hypothetical protein
MIFRSPYPGTVIPEVPLTPFMLRRARDAEDERHAKPKIDDLLAPARRG